MNFINTIALVNVNKNNLVDIKCELESASISYSSKCICEIRLDNDIVKCNIPVYCSVYNNRLDFIINTDRVTVEISKKQLERACALGIDKKGLYEVLIVQEVKKRIMRGGEFGFITLTG